MRMSVNKAQVDFSFVTDEWHMVTGGQIVELTIFNTTLMRHYSSDITFDALMSSGSSNADNLCNNLLQWMAGGLNQLSQWGNFTSTQGSTFANIMQWATLPDGNYHTSLTWRGVSAMAGAVAHYILMQYDGTALGMCEYQAQVGAGAIEGLQEARITYTVVVTVAMLLIVFEVLWWLATTLRTEHVNLAAKSLRSPLKVLYDIRESAANLIPEMGMCNANSRDLRLKLQDINVKYGESAKTLANPIGHLMIGSKAEVLAVRKDRVFA